MIKSRQEKSLKALKRLLPTLSQEEATRVHALYLAGKRTGYPTVDRPWDDYYENLGIQQTDRFLNTTPYEGLVANNFAYPDDLALEYFGAKKTFRGLIGDIESAAKSFQEYGIKDGDFVTICSTETPEVVSAWYSINEIGAVANLISPFYEPDELMARISDCESKVVIMADKFYPKFKDALSQHPEIEVIILPIMNSSILRFLINKDTFKTLKKNTWNRFIKDGRHRDMVTPVKFESKKPVSMVYSSGTTGASKGIILTNECFQHLVNAYNNSGFDTSRNQRVYQNIPPWHSTGISLGTNFPLQNGVTVCMDPRFDTVVFIKNILKYKPQYVLSNTSMYMGFLEERCQKLLNGKSLEFLKYPVEGGEPLTPKDIQAIENIFRFYGCYANLLNGYGSCENGATVTTDITNKKFSQDASGIPLPDITTIGIFDDNGRELKYGERGNIYVLSDISMLEYYKNPQATKDYFFIDSNGDVWSKTEDIGMINEDGSLTVYGRKSDCSVVNGRTFYNFDIARAVLHYSNIKLCEVKQSPTTPDELIAHIVQAGPDAVNYEEVQKLVYELLGDENAVPEQFRIWPSFPSAQSGKRDTKIIAATDDNIIEVPYSLKRTKNKLKN